MKLSKNWGRLVMKSKLETKSLKELCSLIIDCPHSTPKWTSNGKIVVRNNNIRNGKIDLSSPSYTNEENFKQRIKRAIPQSGDIIITREAPMGEVGMIPDGVECCLGQRMVLLRANLNICDNYFLLYSLQSRFVQHQISWSEGTGTTVSNLRIPHLEQLKIPYINISTQKKIASILSALDDKIEVNQKINENLEQQAQAIFKSWFLDFEPFKDGEFVNSEFGQIPKGWHYKQVGELCKSISIKHKFNKDKLIFLNTGDVENGRFINSNLMSVSDMPGQAKKSICEGDILYSEIRPINKHFAYVNFKANDYVVSTKLMVIRAEKIDSRRLYHYLTSNDVIKELQIEAESRSGTFPQIRFDNISILPILIADNETETKFIKILHSFYKKIDYNNVEIEKLTKIRDTLLPKLMNGEIDVNGK